MLPGQHLADKWKAGQVSLESFGAQALKNCCTVIAFNRLSLTPGVCGRWLLFHPSLRSVTLSMSTDGMETLTRAEKRGRHRKTSVCQQCTGPNMATAVGISQEEAFIEETFVLEWLGASWNG